MKASNYESKLKEQNGIFQINRHLINLKIDKAIKTDIDQFRADYKSDIKYFNIYDNDKYYFIQIYLNSDLTLEKLYRLRALNLIQTTSKKQVKYYEKY